MKTKDYQIFERREGYWVIAHVVGETPSGLQSGITDYQHRYKYYDCGFPQNQTGLTCDLKRYYKL